MLKYFLIILAITVYDCNGQTTDKKEIYNKDFNWTITIPENFEHVAAEEWMAMQNRGAEAIEKTYNEEVVNESKTIFVFRSDAFNYFESNYQPYDVSIDGDYLESCYNINGILYETFEAQMPGIKIDSSSTTEKIDNLEFRVFKMNIEYPNKMILKIWMFSRLFDKRELTVNLMYMDDNKGQQMLEAWRNSKFNRK